MRTIYILYALVVPMCGCADESPPFVASLELLGALDSNTCGAGGFDADDSFDETAALYGYAGDDAAFRWTDADDDSTLDGSSTAKGVYQFTATATAVMIVDATGAATCTVERRTKLTLTVTPPPSEPTDAGADADADVDASDTSSDVEYEVTGTLTEDLYSTSGSNCAALRGENGGPFDTFPCRAVYTIVGGSN